MNVQEIQPFIRFADVFSYISDRGVSKTYDSRFLYVLEGSGIIEIEKHRYEIKPYMLVTFQAGTAYHLMPEPSFAAAAVDFDYTTEYAPANTEKIEAFPPISSERFNANKMHQPILFEDYPMLNTPVVIYNLPDLHRHITDLVLEYNSQKLFRLEKSSLLFKNILLEVIRHQFSRSKSSQLSESVLDYIYLHYDKNLTNEKLGEVFHHDPCYLNRLIKSYTGMTLHKCLMQYRITTAVKLLLTGNLSIAEIALQTGFYNTAHFSNCFKKITGHPPSFYRKN